MKAIAKKGLQKVKTLFKLPPDKATNLRTSALIVKNLSLAKFWWVFSFFAWHLVVRAHPRVGIGVLHPRVVVGDVLCVNVVRRVVLVAAHVLCQNIVGVLIFVVQDVLTARVGVLAAVARGAAVDDEGIVLVAHGRDAVGARVHAPRGARLALPAEGEYHLEV